MIPQKYTMPYERAGATERRETMDYGSNSLNAHLRDYRRNTLLNTDYKILYRIIALRLNPVLQEQLRSTQFCVVPGKTIKEAIATLWEAIAFAEFKKVPLCMLSLYFKNDFDRIHILHPTLLSDQRPLRRPSQDYDGATSAIQLNGHIYGPIPIFRCDVYSGWAAPWVWCYMPYDYTPFSEC